jgi:anti-sigma factor RsiW
MNERQKPGEMQPCESWLEAISLLAAECLTVLEEAELREHLAACHACRQRYEEIAKVCFNVRIVKPIVDQERVLAMGQCLQHFPLPVKKVTWRNRSVPMRVAMLAAAALVLVSLLSHLAGRRSEDNPDQRTTIVQVTPQLAPLESADLQLPTMFALRRAAAESDDTFDRLLARYSEPSLLEPLNRHSFSLESLQ